MNRRALSGLLFAAAAAAIALVWWRRRQAASTTTEGDYRDSYNVQGATIREDITPEIVSRAFDFAGDQIKRSNCFSFDHSDHVHWYWTNASGKLDILPAGQRHPLGCGNP